MKDREEIAAAFRRCGTPSACGKQCPYYAKGLHCYQALREDVIRILEGKEQEEVTIKKTKEHGFGVYGGICPKCKNWIQAAHSYCGFCGQAVKWDG